MAVDAQELIGLRNALIREQFGDSRPDLIQEQQGFNLPEFFQNLGAAHGIGDRRNERLEPVPQADRRAPSQVPGNNERKLGRLSRALLGAESTDDFATIAMQDDLFAEDAPGRILGVGDRVENSTNPNSASSETFRQGVNVGKDSDQHFPNPSTGVFDTGSLSVSGPRTPTPVQFGKPGETPVQAGSDGFTPGTQFTPAPVHGSLDPGVSGTIDGKLSGAVGQPRLTTTGVAEDLQSTDSGGETKKVASGRDFKPSEIDHSLFTLGSLAKFFEKGGTDQSLLVPERSRVKGGDLAERKFTENQEQFWANNFIKAAKPFEKEATMLRTFIGAFRGEIPEGIGLDLGSMPRSANLDANGVSDIAMIFATMKVFDPESVVRGSEQDTIRNARSMFGAGFAERMTLLYSGESLTDQQRTNMLETVTTIFRSKFAGYQDVVNTYRDVAERKGLNPNNIVIDVLGDSLGDFIGDSGGGGQASSEAAAEAAGIRPDANGVYSDADLARILDGQ